MKYVTKVDFDNHELLFTNEEVINFLNISGYMVYEITSLYTYNGKSVFNVASKIEEPNLSPTLNTITHHHYLNVFNVLIIKRHKELLKESLLDMSFIRNNKIDSILKKE
jgi:NADPH-dependent 7-cyano-7-deazaguanine reductase QueF-like protein